MPTVSKRARSSVRRFPRRWALVLVLGLTVAILSIAAPALANPTHNGANPNKCLDADTNGLNSNGTKMQLWHCYGGTNQEWDWGPLGLGGREIINRANGKCLDADANNVTHDGAKVQLWNCWGGANQLWAIAWPDTSGRFQILNVASGKCLDADSGHITDDGDRVQLWSCWYTGSVSIGGNTYYIPAPNQAWS